MIDSKLPTAREVQSHYEMGHLPYRNWCAICVRAKGRDMDHARDRGKVRKLPFYGLDYCFPGDSRGFKWTVLVCREQLTGNVMWTTLPEKGVWEHSLAIGC